MRDIKFRAWDKTYSRMVGINGIQDLFSIRSDGYVKDSYILMQYTGLHDKNGVEIYEGDIVLFTYWWFDGNECESELKGTIVYSKECMSFQLKGVINDEWQSFTGYENDTEYLTPFSELNFDEADFEVIGNIHENPELLKGE